MPFPSVLLERRQLAIAATIALTAFQILRLFAFLVVYGGIEHDGGWMLTISRSLAEQGTYTTMVSTVVDPSVVGGIDVDKKFNVQAGDGRVWFMTGNGIGPASIVPDALVLKLFGTGYWSLRLGPLLFCVLFLLLSARILYELSGPGAIVLFHAFLFFHPNLLVFLGYEAMGEVPTLCYVLLAALAFRNAIGARRSALRWYFAAGFLAGLAVNAKFIGLLSVAGLFVVPAGYPLAAAIRPPRRVKRSAWYPVLAMAAGAILPLILWELIQFATLVYVAGVEAYVQHLQQRRQFVLDDGSGLGLQVHSGMEFLLYKFLILSEVAAPEAWATALNFLALLAGGAFVAWRMRARAPERGLFAVLWVGWLANTAWFVALAKTGWVRHYYFGLMLAILLLPIITGMLLRGTGPAGAQGAASAFRRHASPSGVLGLLLLALIAWGFASQPFVRNLGISDELVAKWQQDQVRDLYGARLPWIVIPSNAQSEIADYIRDLPPAARIYYVDGHKTAELPARTGKLHYPLQRRQTIPPEAQDYLVIGPSLISPWLTADNRRRGREIASRECQRPILVNDYYMLCALSSPGSSASYTPVAVAFRNGIKLLGYDVLKPASAPGDSLALSLYWQSDQKIPQAYKVFVQLVGTQWNRRTNNPLWGQSDQEPARWRMPTPIWETGAVIEDAHVLRIASDAPPGKYRLEAGMYLAAGGERLLTSDGADHVVLLEVDVR